MPGLRRAGRVEPGQEAARVPVLRHRVPVRVRRRHREDPGTGPRQGAARDPRGGSRLEGRAAQRPVPELQGRHGVRPGTGRPELRVLRVAGPGRLRGDQVAHPAAERPPVQGDPERHPRQHPPLVREQVVRAERAEVEGARGPAQEPVRPLLDLRRAGALPLDGRGGPLLLRERGVSRQQGPGTGPAGAEGAVGARRRRDRSRLRRRAGARDAGRRARPAEAGRAVPDDANSCPTTPRTCRATSSSTTRWCWSTRRNARARRWTRS